MTSTVTYHSGLRTTCTVIELLRDVGKHCPVQLSIHPDIDAKVDWGAWG